MNQESNGEGDPSLLQNQNEGIAPSKDGSTGLPRFSGQAPAHLKAGIIGVTGLVGQRLALMLSEHPWFEISELAASDRSAGKTYEEACSWRMPQPMPDKLKSLQLKSADLDNSLECDFIFSSLPSAIAGDVEERFAKAGYPVVSNSSNHRLDPDVPLIIPEINQEHIEMIPVQRKQRKFDTGFIVTNPNCTTIALCLGIAPFERLFGLHSVQVTSMQALSGAGQSGVASMDIIDNVIPFIQGEEEKVESEPLKIFGRFNDSKIENAPFKLSAQCNRVNVSDGHLLSVSVKLQRTPDENEFIDAIIDFRSPISELPLPSAPDKPVVLMQENSRPQPRLDRERENGMASIIGRVRPCPVLDFKFVVLGHNTIRGAAGAAILNAELLVNKGFL